MESLLALIGMAIVLFASTNVDDVFVLVGFLAEKRIRTRDAVLGQYIGITILFSASVAASLLTFVIPRAYIGLLGMIPILIGGKKLFELYQQRDRNGRSFRTSLRCQQKRTSRNSSDGDVGERWRQHWNLHAFVCYPLGSRNHRNCSRFRRDDCTLVFRSTHDSQSSEIGLAHSPVWAPCDSRCASRTWNADPPSSG